MEAKEPCIECPNKKIDDYGYFCDLACGKRTAWLNYKAGEIKGFKTGLSMSEPYNEGKQKGVKEVVEWIKTHYLVGPDKDSITQFKPFYSITLDDLEANLKEWGIENGE